MSVVRVALTVVAAIASLAFLAGAEDAKEAAETESHMGFKSQTHCPVMGGEIDSTVFTDIQGQRVYHCCPGCSKMLKEDPDKYFEKAAADSIIFQNIQTICPVGGEPLGSEPVYTYYEGRTVALCCAKCGAVFAENPEEYLKKLDEEPERTEKARVKENCSHEKSGHMH